MDIGLFDNFEDDGQLSLFGLGEEVEDLRETDSGEERGAEQLPSSGSAGIRIRRCSCCGKLLFVREEENCYLAVCNACGVSYMQKI